jgi:hypothetical protein
MIVLAFPNLYRHAIITALQCGKIPTAVTKNAFPDPTKRLSINIGKGKVVVSPQF